MSKILLGFVVGAFALFAWQRVHHPEPPAPAALALADPEPVERPSTSENPEAFRCDGRIYCSQMHSCEEATFFLRNCPGVKMDGEGDGIPCEKQWCGHR
jgi:hypothetical protein